MVTIELNNKDELRLVLEGMNLKMANIEDLIEECKEFDEYEKLDELETEYAITTDLWRRLYLQYCYNKTRKDKNDTRRRNEKTAC